MKKKERMMFPVLLTVFSIVLTLVTLVYAQENITTVPGQATPSTPVSTSDVNYGVLPEGQTGQKVVSESASSESIMPQTESPQIPASNGDVSDEDVQKILVNQGIPLTTAARLDEASTYTLGADDIIKITVERHPELSGEYAINSEGKIQYEFVGDIELNGLNKEKATELIKEKVSRYIISPQATVSILQYNSKVVYVIGEVGAPGKIFMRGDTMTIREALIQAGLPLLSAKNAKSRLITPTANGKPKIIHVNVHKLIYEGDLRENLVMKPGDVLYIPPTIMAKVLRVIQPVAAPVVSAGGAAGTATGL